MIEIRYYEMDFYNLSKEAKVYKVLYEACLKQINNNIEIARQYMREGKDISSEGSLLVHLDAKNYILELKEKLERNF